MSSLISSLPGQSVWPAAIRWAEFRYAIVESPAEVRFLGPQEVQQAAEFPRGVAFGPDAELRWMRRPAGHLHFVYLSDNNLPFCVDAPHQSPLERMGDATEPQHMFLWSASDGRIPRTPSYPLPDPDANSRLAVRVRHYQLANASTGIPTRLYRCVDLIPVKIGGPA
ncbi:MAG: hypothetical protein LAO78_11200 [Acidobacteriia bacterium]|nr:hypothetical protein [Terriglobia bacterium]